MGLAGAARVIDAVAVAGLVVSGQVTAWSAGGLEGGRPLHAALLALITAPLLVRRRWPLVVLLLVATSTVAQYELGGGAFQPWFALLLATYAVAAHAERAVASAGATVVAVLTLAVDLPRLTAGEPVDEVVPAWFVMAGTWLFGRWMRAHRADTAALVTRAEEAERTRAERAERAVAQERARIARELHDLVAHSMSVVVIQAQAGSRALAADGAAAAGALAAIESTGRQGMAELRRLLGLLTDDGDEAVVSPAASLRRLDDLIATVAATGVSVQARVTGDVADLPPGVDLAAYRIVQESLTNVLKHASASRVQVAIDHQRGCLKIEVRDDGTGSGAAAGEGRGLVGLRERAALYGGALDAGPARGGGFCVRARLPVAGDLP